MNELEKKVLNFLERNDPYLISQLLDIPYDKAALATTSYLDTCKGLREIHTYQLEKIGGQFVRSLLKDGQRHD